MKDARSGISTIAEYAADELSKAERLERRTAFDPVDGFHKEREAERAREDAERLMKPPKRLVGGASTEIVPASEAGATVPNARQFFLSTLADPNTISVDASEHRAAVATRAGVLSPALDAAMSARAKNSLEKMLCHQIAAVHFAGMEVLVRLQEDERLPPVELARLTNAMARMFEVCQSGCLTLQKLKTGGAQRVIVQHQQQVHIGPGGQAVVAGKVKGARAPRGRPRK